MYALTRCRVFDGFDARLRDNATVLVSGERITDVVDGTVYPPGCEVIDCAGRVLMPGLIDAHIHACASRVNLLQNDLEPTTFVAQHAGRMLCRMLDRGFTTVRDCGGADHGLAMALREGLIAGPQLFYAGKMLSQRGGHGDMRQPLHADAAGSCWSCGHGHIGHLSMTADGVDEIRRAVRENFHRGASFIKFAGSGGVASAAGSVTALQYSDEEVRTIVGEAERHESYCTAHVHPDEGIRRVIELGVHCIEHGSLISAETARMAADRGTFIVPTLAIAVALKERGIDLGLAPVSATKLEHVYAEMLERLHHMKIAGVQVGFGTDLLGPLERYQCMEFELRGQVYSPVEILRQATSSNAMLLRRAGEIGVIRAGAQADLLVVDGNPLEDLKVFREDGGALMLIMQRGRIHRLEDRPIAMLLGGALERGGRNE